jgi:uncharacterized protein involved in outer membrane biogenesis
MKKLFKWLAVSLVVVVIAIGATAVIVPMVVDPNDYKDTLADAVKEHTGRTLAIEGDLKLTVFPWLGVDAGPVELGQAASITDIPYPAGTPFLRSERTQIRVKLMPLLSGRVEMDTVMLEGLVVNLGRSPQGMMNWDDFVTPTAKTNDEPPAIAALAIGGLNVQQAQIHWRDALTQARYELTGLTLTTGAVDIDDLGPINVSASFTVQGADAALPTGTVEAAVSFDANVAFDSAAQSVGLSDLTLSSTFRDPVGDKVTFAAAGDLAYNMASGTANTSQLTLSANTAGYLGTVAKVDTSLEGANVDTATGIFSAKMIKATGAVSGAVLGDGQVTFDIAAATRVDLSSKDLLIEGLNASVPSFSVDGNSGQATLRGTVRGSMQTGRFEIRGLDLATSVTGTALSGGNVSLTTKGDIDFDANNLVATSPAIELVSSAFDVAGYAGSFRATAALSANPSGQQFSASGLAADGTLAKGPGFNGALPFLLRGDLNVDLARNLITTKELRLESSAFDVDAASGNLSTELTNASVALDRATLTADRINATGSLTGKGAFTGKADIELNGSALTANTDAVNIKTVHLRLPAFDVNGSRGVLDARGSLRAALGKDVVTIGGLKAKGRLSGAALKGGKVTYDGTTNARFQPTKGQFDLSKLVLKLTDLEYDGLEGSLKLGGAVVGNTNKGIYTGKRVSVRGAVKGNAVPGGATNINVLTDLTANTSRDTLRLSTFNARALGLHASGNLSLAQLSKQPTYSGNVTLAGFKPRPLLRRLGLGNIKTTDPKALSRVSGSATVTGGPGQLALKKLVLNVDQSTLRGNVDVKGLQRTAPRPYVQFNLTLNGIDADRYMPPTKGTSGDTPVGAVPIALLTTVDLDGQLNIGKLKANNLRVSNFKVTARGKDRKLVIDPITANLYRGTVNAKGTIDTSTATPRVALEKHFRGVQAGPLLTDLQGKAAVTGTTDFDLTLRTQGLSEDQLLGNANGTTRFTLRDGTIEGVNMVGEICSKLSSFGVVSAPASGGDSTAFSDLNGSGDIRNGVLYNQDMAMVSPFLRVAGEGNIQLVQQIVGYAVTAHLVDSCAGAGRGVVNNLVDIPIPVRVSGPVSNLRYGFDFDKLFASLTQQQIQKQGTRFLEKALGGRSSGNAGTSDSAGSAEPGGSTEEKLIKGLLKGLFK